MIRICQMVHPSRPHVNYSEFPRIERYYMPGRRRDNEYLRCIRDAWMNGFTNNGLVILEQDIAIDLRHIEEMDLSIRRDPANPACCNYPIWPVSSGADHAFWSVSRTTDRGEQRTVALADEPPTRTSWFPLGFTYLPPAVIEAAPDNDRPWDYPILDARFSELAQRMGLHANVLPTPAVHLHW